MSTTERGAPGERSGRDRRPELCALVATTPLSARTLRLLAAIVLEEERLAAIAYGALTVALAPGRVQLELKDVRPRITFGSEDR